MAEAEPDVIVHELTALSDSLDLRHFDRDFATTNRLRTEATDHLLAAGRAVGVKRFVAQSFAGWPYERVGRPGQDRGRPARPEPVRTDARDLAAIRHLEEAVTGADWTEGIALRYGGFYGPGTSLWPGGEQLELIRERKFPVVGNGAGVWSLVRIDDAADGHRGRDRAREARHLQHRRRRPRDGRASGCPAWPRRSVRKPPRQVPRWLGRLFAGEAGVVMMTELRGASNAKAKRELGWQPRHPSWREGTRARR